MCLGSDGELPDAKANTTSPRSSGEISRGSHQGCFTEEKLRVLGFWGSAGRCYVTGKTCQAGGPDDHKRSQATCWEQRHGLTEATHRTSAHRNPHSSVSWPLETTLMPFSCTSHISKHITRTDLRLSLDPQKLHSQSLEQSWCLIWALNEQSILRQKMYFYRNLKLK